MSEPVYRTTISRNPSLDFLEEMQGALFQAQVLSVANELFGPFGPVQAVTSFAEGVVRLVLTAPDPEHLADLSETVMLRYGQELPEPEEVSPDASQPPLFATQSSYSARDVYGTVGQMVVESTAKALLPEALERENLNDQDGLAEHFRDEVHSYRRVSHRLGVHPPTETSALLQAGRALLSAVPEESFMGEAIAGDGGQAVLALLKEKRLITEEEAITAAPHQKPASDANDSSGTWRAPSASGRRGCASATCRAPTAAPRPSSRSSADASTTAVPLAACGPTAARCPAASTTGGATRQQRG